MININLIVIRTNQLHELARFYEQIGMQFEYHQHGKGVWHYAAILGEVVFEIYPLLKNQSKPDNSLRLGFTVEKLDDLIEKLQAQHIEINSLPQRKEWGYVAIIKDLDGRKIELKEKE